MDVGVKLIKVMCGTYKFHGTVVDKEILNPAAPVRPESEVSVAL